MWDFAARRYQRLWPVDAHEQIGLGRVALHVVELIGPDGPEIVGADVEDVLPVEGWRRPGDPVPTADDPPDEGDLAAEGGGTGADTPAQARAPLAAEPDPEPDERPAKPAQRKSKGKISLGTTNPDHPLDVVGADPAGDPETKP